MTKDETDTQNAPNQPDDTLDARKKLEDEARNDPAVKLFLEIIGGEIVKVNLPKEQS